MLDVELQTFFLQSRDSLLYIILAKGKWLSPSQQGYALAVVLTGLCSQERTFLAASISRGAVHLFLIYCTAQLASCNWWTIALAPGLIRIWQGRSQGQVWIVNLEKIG